MTCTPLRTMTFVSALALGLLSGCTDAGRCELGAIGCLCDATTCELGGRCVGGMCEACPAGTAECPCAALSVCDPGLACVRSENRCVAAADTVCEDTCFFDWNGDGSCDDGGEGSAYSACNLGADCSDCGARRNPCTDPDYSVFCPATPNYPLQCWQPGVDCGSIELCGGTTPHACFDGYRYDCDTSMCVENPCSGTGSPVFCEYDASCDDGGTTCCFDSRADCRTATACFDNHYVCLGRLANGPLQVSCGATVDDVSCVLPP